jgi:hypothetical protein
MSKRDDTILRATDDRAAQPPLGASVGVGRRARDREPSPHALKFLIATTTLFVVGLIAVAVAFVTAHNATNAGPPPAWSSWSPPDTGTQGAIDIANHLSPFYRLSQTDQLDAIDVLNVPNPSSSASSVSQAANPIVEVALQQQAPRSRASAVQLLGGHTIAYNLCGLGVNNSSCLIGEGTPSSNRLLLLRREALELSLYTFRYLPTIQNVVAILPPGLTQQTSTLSPTPPSSSSAGSTPQPLDLAVLYDRQELQQFTQAPLSTTLPLKYPPTVAELPLWRQTADAAIVDQLTAHALFSDQIKHTVDGNLLLLLTPVAPQ